MADEADGPPSIAEQLGQLLERCAAMAELQQPCEDLLERLLRAQGRLDDRPSSNQDDEIQARLGRLGLRFLAFLTQHGHKSVFERLVSARTLLAQLHRFHADVAVVEEAVGASQSWDDTWAESEQQVETLLQQLWRANAGAFDDLCDASVQSDALLLLSSEMARSDYSAKSREVLEAATTQLVRLSGVPVPAVPAWFIPEHEVQRELRPFARGGFGEVFRGTWGDRPVVIKCVSVRSQRDKRTFLREARIWHMAEHRHIVQFYGACHLSDPCFFLCEEAANGNLVDFLDAAKPTRPVVWRLLSEVASGLQFLHRNGIVHGDLKCNQILVSRDGVAKLTDFGLSFISDESRPLESTGSIRWKAPECLVSADQAPTTQSDLYSFGMCIVEALTELPPWGIHLPDAIVIDHLRRREFLPQPDRIDGVEWDLVLSLCAFEPSKRASLASVMNRMQKFVSERIADSQNQDERPLVDNVSSRVDGNDYQGSRSQAEQSEMTMKLNATEHIEAEGTGTTKIRVLASTEPEQIPVRKNRSPSRYLIPSRVTPPEQPSTSTTKPKQDIISSPRMQRHWGKHQRVSQANMDQKPTEEASRGNSVTAWNDTTLAISHATEPNKLELMIPSGGNVGNSKQSRVSKGDAVFIASPHSVSSDGVPYSKLARDRIGLGESTIDMDEPGSRLRMLVRLKLPTVFKAACFVSLDFFLSKEAIDSNDFGSAISNTTAWKCVGTTEPLGGDGKAESELTTGSACVMFPFVSVLEVPVIGQSSNTLLRFMVHTQRYLDRSSSSSRSLDTSSNPQLSFQMTMFHPVLEFVTSSQAVLDAAASGHCLNMHPTDDQASADLKEFPLTQSEINSMLMGNTKNAELSVQTVMMPGDIQDHDEGTSHKHIGNIIRFFQYDANDGKGGLIVEDLQESIYSNAISRQLVELISVERQEQVDRAREDLHAFLNKKKDKQSVGFYGRLFGQARDSDYSLALEWLDDRVRRRKEYVAMLRRNILYLVNRDKHKNYLKASVETQSEDLRFVPINLHTQDLLIGPTHAFINDEKRRSSKEVSAYDFTTVGAPAAHVYNFSKGGILSYENRRRRLEAKSSGLDASKWPKEVRACDDLKWELQLRMDCAFAQALSALTCSFVRKVEGAIQHPSVAQSENMLQLLSTVGFLFHVESLLSTNKAEIGMLEDMAAAVERLSCVAFVLQEAYGGSFRKPRRGNVEDEAGVVKVGVANKTGTKRTHIKYLVTVQVATSAVELPARLAAGGEIRVIPVLFSQSINEVVTANKELQDLVNLRSFKVLKSLCAQYGPGTGSSTRARSTRSSTAGSVEGMVTQELRYLEQSIYDAAQASAKTKHPDILQRSSDLCRELGGGRVTVCKNGNDLTAMSVTLEQVRILQRHHDLPAHRVPATVSVMRSHGVRIENTLKNTGRRQFSFNRLQRSLLPEEYRSPD